MNGGDLHLALREIYAHMTAPLTLAALAGVALILGISGPFGTLQAFALIPRIGYWAVVVPLTYAAGTLGTRAAHRFLPIGPRALRIKLAALGSALAVTPVLALFNASLGIPLGGPRAIILGFLAVYIVCLVIETISNLMQDRAAAPFPIVSAPAPAPAALAALLARLPLEKRGPLLALSATDHYTEIITAKGRELVLIRLADAIAEAAPTGGLHIHRSHWVAIAAVTSASQTEVALSDGTRLPIARARLPAVRAAGLLPKKGT